MSEIERCPTCGSSVRLEGTITRYFMPVENERIADLERQLAAYEKAACCQDEQSCKYRSQLANKQSEIDRLKERLAEAVKLLDEHVNPPEGFVKLHEISEWHSNYLKRCAAFVDEARKPK